jgi:uncharacterized protein (DUF1778 family)
MVTAARLGKILSDFLLESAHGQSVLKDSHLFVIDVQKIDLFLDDVPQFRDETFPLVPNTMPERYSR